KYAALQKGGEPALLYMDFSGMKFYNRKYGFAEGDKLLQAFSQILIRNYGNDHCCRIGGDHFAVITVTNGLEERLHHIFREAQDINGGKSLPVHVGIYSGQEGHVHASIACDMAKLACGELNGAYASCFNYFSQQMSDDAERKQYIIENIDRAISEQWIQVYYQPIVRATNRNTCEEEALSRWIDPDKGFLSPAEFIPALEASGLIYKLDLYVLQQALEKLQSLKKAGLPVVPQSINLSRSDFDTCDIVEEIRGQVDRAGIPRDRITVEITESIIGSDFDFIKRQVLRFRELGFKVWIDDFGSGYSSLDVLQSLKFDLIKFDMGFMRKLNEGENARTILKELMQMATSLGVDTICEGVETEEQVRFLEEIGCSKLQGYYFSKPVPFDEHALSGGAGPKLGYENPEESAYYDAIGKVNLYDLSSIVNEDENILQGIFNTLPMSVMEVRDGKGRYVRSNQSYRDFMKRCLHIDLSEDVMDFAASPTQYGLGFIRIIQQCCSGGNRAFFDEKMADGSTAHCFVRRIGQNAVTGNTAIAIAVLSVTDPEEGTSYADIARALAMDYYNIYIVDLDTERFIEYTSHAGGDELAIERHGTDFFEAVRRDAMVRIYEDDRELFTNWFSRENIIRELGVHGVFTATYRLIDSGAPVYVNMKVTRMQPGGNRIIMGISVIDAQMKQKEHYDELQRERSTLVRVMALSDGYLSLYTVDPETGYYVEYTCSDDFASLGAPKEGEDFFRQLIDDAPKYLKPEDRDNF
ncbi:MAG: EAL domain-containing protein, partial [Clostridia bacterium]|nr:EAL domain-containing protein [Clostridia bacterium]